MRSHRELGARKWRVAPGKGRLTAVLPVSLATAGSGRTCTTIWNDVRRSCDEQQNDEDDSRLSDEPLRLTDTLLGSQLVTAVALESRRRVLVSDADVVQRAAVPAAPSRTVPSRTGLAALVFAIGLAAAPSAAGQDRAVQTVDKVDLSRYVGEWFEIARFSNRFQRQCLGGVVRAVYTIRQDGRLDVVNRCRTDDSITQARGVARIVDSRTATKLKVRLAPAVLSFLPAVWGDYWVVGLASDYSWATVGSPDRKYLWILGRTSSMGTEAYAAALEAARSNGFDVARLYQDRPGRPSEVTAIGPCGFAAIFVGGGGRKTPPRLFRGSRMSDLRKSSAITVLSESMSVREADVSLRKPRH